MKIKAFSIVKSLVRIHLISMLDVYELLKSKKKAYVQKVAEPPVQLQLKLF